VTQSLGRNTPIEDREVHGMEYAVAETGERSRQCEHGVMARSSQHETRDGEATHAEHQHAARSEAIDRKPSRSLSHARDDEEDRHERADLGVAQSEVAHQPREQRRQHQVEKMRRAVREPDQPDHTGVLASGVGLEEPGFEQ
jgi:hypothetical protein